MAPDGVWLPWTEVLMLASRFGTDAHMCEAAPPLPRNCKYPTDYARIRLLPASEEKTCFLLLRRPKLILSCVSSRCFGTRSLKPTTPKVSLWTFRLPLGWWTYPCLCHSMPRKCISCRFFDLWQIHRQDRAWGLSDGVCMSIPAWAAELFECGFPWTAELVRACSEGDFYETEEFRPASSKLAVTRLWLIFHDSSCGVDFQIFRRNIIIQMCTKQRF